MAARCSANGSRPAQQTLAQQAQICNTLEQTAAAHRGAGRGPCRAAPSPRSPRLVQTASEAPRAAAEVVAQLRQQLSDSMARDNSLLDERSRIMATLNTLLDAVQHSATEQRAAIDALVASSPAVLEQAGTQLQRARSTPSPRAWSRGRAAHRQRRRSGQPGRSLRRRGRQCSAESSDKLMAHLQRVEDALGRSIARSDEQLAYYVAQAREVIDLSLSSQKQIVDDLQRMAGRRAALAARQPHDRRDRRRRRGQPRPSGRCSAT